MDTLNYFIEFLKYYIKNSKLILKFILIFGLLINICCSTTIEDNIYSIDKLEKLKKPSLPIKSDTDAIKYAIHVEKVIDSLSRAQSSSNFDGWAIKARKIKGDLWKVNFKSIGVLPSYECEVIFYPSGRLMKDKKSSIKCGYNK